MKRLFLCLTMVTTALWAAPPAGADVDICSGHLTMSTSAGLGTRGIFPARSVEFGFSTGLANCIGPSGVAGGGTLTGWCESYWGYGTTHDGHRFAITDGAITGELTGAALVVDDPGDAGSCVAGTATRFVGIIAVLKTHGVPVVSPQPHQMYCSTTQVEC